MNKKRVISDDDDDDDEVENEDDKAMRCLFLNPNETLVSLCKYECVRAATDVAKIKINTQCAKRMDVSLKAREWNERKENALCQLFLIAIRHFFID